VQELKKRMGHGLTDIQVAQAAQRRISQMYAGEKNAKPRGELRIDAVSAGRN
jgi:hypothetical protein